MFMFEEKVCKKKNWGSPCLFLKSRSKRPFWRQVVTSIAIATDSVVLKIMDFKSRNINLSLVTGICQMKFKYAKSECVKLPETQIFKNCIEPPLSQILILRYQCNVSWIKNLCWYHGLREPVFQVVRGSS